MPSDEPAASSLQRGITSGRIPRPASSLWYFTRADGEPMTFAGLWDEWKNKATGGVLKSCTMLITEPNDFVAEVHDRMPVVLESKDFASWLNDGGTPLLKPAANDVLPRWPVSRRVNSSRAPADDPNPIERVEVT
jgi:putative SOS response-associated peptidase YedK